jgi:hypothetical protein
MVSVEVATKFERSENSYLCTLVSWKIVVDFCEVVDYTNCGRGQIFNLLGTQNWFLRLVVWVRECMIQIRYLKGIWPMQEIRPSRSHTHTFTDCQLKSTPLGHNHRPSCV